MLTRDIRIAGGGVYFIVSLILYYVSVDVSSNLLNFLGVSFLLMTGLVILSLKGGWLFFLYVFGLSFAMVSGTVIEWTGAYLMEVGQYAQLTGAAARNSFLSVLFVAAAGAAYVAFMRLFLSGLPSFRLAEPALHWMLLALAFGAPIYYAAVLMIYGSPLSIGMDRFSYMTNVAPSLYRWVHGVLPLLGLVVAMAVSKGIVRLKVALSWLLFVMTIYVFGGEKFSGIVILLFLFGIPFFALPGKRLSLPMFGLIAIFLLGSVGVVLLNYYLVYGHVDLFVSRLALQGQMNYAIDSLVAAPSLHGIMASFIGLGSEQGERGIAYLMYQIADSSRVDWMLQHNARFTAPFPANLTLFFGSFLAPMVVLMFSFVAGFTAALLRSAVRDGNLILSVVALKLFLMGYVAITMGDVYLFFEWKAFLLYFLVFCYFLVMHVNRLQKALSCRLFRGQFTREFS